MVACTAGVAFGVHRYVSKAEEASFEENFEDLDVRTAYMDNAIDSTTAGVTPESEVVWEWITPIIGSRPGGRELQWVYRANRYAADHPAFVGKDLDPNNYAELNAKYELS